jgi:hypothetical protein
MKKILFFISFVISACLNAQVTSSLTACYALNGDASDPISSLNGTLGLVTSVSDRNNNAGFAYSFAGNAASRITLPNDLKIKANEMSFSAWVKPSNTSSSQYILFTKNTASSNFEAYALSIGSGGIFTATKGNNGNVVSVSTTNSISSNTWHHVTFTFDNSGIKIYLDGVFEALTNSTLSVGYDATKNVYLGGSNESFNLPFTGSLDNVRFYNRAITATEVTALYSGDPSCSAAISVDLTASLTACYALNANANDPISSLNGTLGAVTATVDRNSTSNSAYSFSGAAASNISLPNDAKLKSSEFSFAAWIKPVIINNSQYILFTKNTASSNFEAYALSFGSTGLFTVTKGNNGSVVSVSSTGSVSSNTWHHVAFTFNSSSLQIYLDGSPAGSNNSQLAVNYDATKNVYLGGSNETFNLPFTGSIDNVRFYNRMINSTEISLLYAQDPSCSTNVTVTPTGIHQPLNESLFTIYPNPTNGFITIKSSSNTILNYRVFDVIGKQVLAETTLIESNQVIDVTTLSKGIYFLSVKIDDEIFIKKFIKE